MTIFNTIVEALRPLCNDDVQMTLAGKEGQGNQNVRLHWQRDNLLTKVLYRHDLSRLGADSEEVKMYLAHLSMPQSSPWTSIPGKNQVQLTAILKAAGIDQAMFLDASNDVADKVLEAYESFDRTHAFVRQWSAKGRGTGLEVIVVFKNGDEFAIIESSLNFYIEPDASKLIRILRERKETEEKANIKTPDVNVVVDGVETTV